MKVTFITHALGGGGSEHVLTIVANYLASKGHIVSIISRTHKTNQYYVDDQISINYVETSSHILFIKESRRLLKQNRPNTVISFEYFYNLCAVIICFGLNIKLIISERNDPSRVGSGILKDIIRNILYSFADVLICQTNDALNYFPYYIRKKAHIILNPIMPGLPRAVNLNRENIIVNFCRLNKQKNIPLLLHSFKEFIKIHPDYQLHIYGNGEEKENIKNLILKLDLSKSVRLFDNCPDVHSKILTARMYVSSSDFEGLSNSMLEAMAIGLPTICTDCPCGGARMVIEDGYNGLLTAVGDSTMLVNKMCTLAEDDSLCSFLSNNALKINKDLAVSSICKIWESYI